MSSPKRVYEKMCLTKINVCLSDFDGLNPVVFLCQQIFVVDVLFIKAILSILNL